MKFQGDDSALAGEGAVVLGDGLQSPVGLVFELLDQAGSQVV